MTKMSVIHNLEAMLDRGQDSPLLRYSLGNEYLKAGQPEAAIRHLAIAVDRSPTHSASWKLYGRALAAAGRLPEAIAAFGTGMEVAQRQGDLQAVKEMTVFRRRVEKELAGVPSARREPGE